MVALGGSERSGRGAGGGVTGFGAGGGVTFVTGAGAGGRGAGGLGAGALATGAGRAGGGGGVGLTTGARSATRTGAASCGRLRSSQPKPAITGIASSSHKKLKPFFSVSVVIVLPGAAFTEVVPSAVGALAPKPGILAARAAGMVTRPAAFDHWISVPSGPTNLPVCRSSVTDVSAVGYPNGPVTAPDWRQASSTLPLITVAPHWGLQ